MTSEVSFEAFKEQWLSDIIEGNPSPTELGRRFSRKLISQHFDIDLSTENEDFFECDGARDGGIDIAYLKRADPLDTIDNNDESSEGDTWYLVQSKHGTAFQGAATLFEEGRKVLDTITGVRTSLSSLSSDIVTSLSYFANSSSSRDRIVLLFATEKAITEPHYKSAIADIQTLGLSKLGLKFDVETVSIENIYRATIEDEDGDRNPLLETGFVYELSGKYVSATEDLVTGAVGLLDLFYFLRDFKRATGDLDQLYEKNVRRYLGMRGTVNKSMKKTIEVSPENFGLYNNGITIVVKDFVLDNGKMKLQDPYIVNGCQTSKTIYETIRPRLEAGGTATQSDDDWKAKARQGVVITKIVKVGPHGWQLLKNITVCTNSQNRISGKDFLALNLELKQWAQEMARDYSIFLEVQKGGWESQQALQKKKPSAKQFKDDEYANAFDLLKVYGAGWYGEVGKAWRNNQSFLPGAPLFNEITGIDQTGYAFSARDLYAALCLQRAANRFNFGRSISSIPRRISRYLFYYVSIQFINYLLGVSGIAVSRETIVNAILRLSLPENVSMRDEFYANCINVIDEYMSPTSKYSAYKEEAYNNNINTFMKSDQLGKSESYTPKLTYVMEMWQRLMNTSRSEDGVSLQAKLVAAISDIA